MRKLSVFSMTALAAVMMAGMPAMTTQASMYTFRIPAGMSGNSINTCLDSTNQGIVYGGNNNDCVTLPFIPGGEIIQPSLPSGEIIQPSLPECENKPELPELPNKPEQPDKPSPPDNGGSKPERPEIPEQPDQPGKPEVDRYAEAVLELVNVERAKAGVGALTLDDKAQEAADVRAAEIQRSFSHTRPDGSNFSTALTEAGIRYTSSGENIAYGQNSPDEVMQGWMNSSGHRANILNKDFTYIGIGHMETADGVDYWTQLFYR